MKDGFDFSNFWEAARTAAEAVCIQYTESSPVTSRWADNLFVRLDEDMESVTMMDLQVLGRFLENGIWADAHLAQNMVYKLMKERGQAEGMLSF